MTKYVYHFVPKNMVGSILYPLNQLKDFAPKSFEQEIRKYEGRERILKKEIPTLGCLWNDVLHFSPINPQKVADKWIEMGLFDKSELERKQLSFFKVPVSSLNPELTCIYQSFNFERGNFDSAKERFSKFYSDQYSELECVSAEQVAVWIGDREHGRSLFWYSHTPHILVKHPVDTKGCEVVALKF